MATTALITGRASALPLHLLAQAVPMLSRHELAALTERLIERLDEIDGDPDLEDDDPGEEDDPAGVNDEDGVNIPTEMVDYGPGCPLSDPPEVARQPVELG